MFQLLLGFTGLAAAAIAAYLLLHQAVPVLAPKQILYAGVILGAMLALVALLGVFGAWSAGNRPALIGYMLIILGLLGISVMGLSIIGRNSAKEPVQNLMEGIWNGSDDAVIYQIQAWGQCCGLFNATDRIQEPCEQFDPPVGCYEPMAEEYRKTLALTSWPLMTLVGGELLGLTFCAILLWCVWKERSRERAASDRQSFDTWHKAVFQ